MYKSRGCEVIGKPVEYMCDCKDKVCSCDLVMEFGKVEKIIQYFCRILDVKLNIFN
ncbi:MAG: hypothetical protein JXA91_03400 [Candidatus Thermoplasmatota archaeon]|nr:hypothetical protein [Candidatus Thermoplasmatota archaeon]